MAGDLSPTRLFDDKVRDYALAPSGRLDETASVQQAWDAARGARGWPAVTPIAVVTNEGRCAGSFEPRDVLDWLARGARTSDRITPLLGERHTRIDANARLIDAVIAMQSKGQQWLAITEASGRFLGYVTMNEILRRGMGPDIDTANLLAADATVPSLQRILSRAATSAATLLDAGTPSERVLEFLTQTNAELHRRALALVLDDIAADGWGPPPVPFALIVMGSTGRAENFLLPDQDNALVIADFDEAQRPAIDSYFVTLAERLTRALSSIGFELCKGNVMATNPVWRKSLSEWCEQIDIWTSRRQPIHMLHSDVLLDCLHVAGDVSLTAALRRHMIERMSANPVFVRDLYRIEQDHGVALNWFGMLKRETSDHEEAGAINLKMHGTLPLVEGARLLSLQARIDTSSTFDRLSRLAAAGSIGDDDAAELLHAFRTIAELLLGQQIADARARRPISDYVRDERLGKRDRARLRPALRAIEQFRSDLPSRLGI